MAASLKVLVVDDSALMRRHLSELLREDPSIEVEVANNGKQALEALERFSPDVITLDINMPEMDGVQMTKIIRDLYKENEQKCISPQSPEIDSPCPNQIVASKED